MSQWLVRNRVPLFIGLNVLLGLALLVTAPMHGVAFGQVLYAVVLFGLCTVPLTLLESLNGRYALLQIFMLTYFLHFGGLDVQHILLGVDAGPGANQQLSRTEFMLPAEALVLACGVTILLSYLGIARTHKSRNPAAVTSAEWSMGTMLVAGLVFWCIGTAAEVYMGVFVIPESGNRALAQGLGALGSVGAFALMLGRLMQPLGLLLLAYGYARFRGIFWTGLIIVLVLSQAAAGFVTDVKTTAMMGVVVVVVVRFLVGNRLPVTWMISAVVAIALAFPVFQANRLEVSGERGINHMQAFQNIGRVLQIAIASRDKVSQTNLEERPPTFLERVYIKDNLEQVVEHVGIDVPYLYGSSLRDIAFAFIPRLVIGDKQSFSMGQLFTHQIAHSNLDTYISISHLGEFFWNFGWTGAIVGALVTGLILGIVGSWFNLENGPSLTHVMILLVTVQNLCIGFEGEISISYVVWMRALAAIGLLHLMFARRRTVATSTVLQAVVPAQKQQPALTPTTIPVPSIRFPNVMR